MKRIHEDKKEEIINLYNNGKTLKEISKVFNCHSSTIGRILQRNNIQLRSTTGPNIDEYLKNKKEFKNKLEELYIKQDLSANDTGMELGLSCGTVIKYIKYFKIPVKQNMRQRLGSNNKSWKGGKYTKKGYIYVHSPGHFRSHNGYVAEHILVMEQHLGRPLKYYGKGHRENEVVHHKNGIRNDNRIENLEVMPHYKHTMEHFNKKINLSYKKCYEIASIIINCKDKTIDNIANIIMENVND